MKLKQLTLAGLAIALLSAGAASATTALKMSEEDLATGSDVIVVGQVSGHTTSWVDKTLVTLVTVDVDEVIKGEAGNQITVMVPGGTDTARQIPITVTYAGAPVLTPDERVFLFLDAAGNGVDTYTVSGFSQGKYSIVESPQGVQKVTRDLTDLTLQSKSGAERAGAVSAESLADFAREIRSMVQAKVGRKPAQR